MAAYQLSIVIWLAKTTLAALSSSSRCLSETGPIPSGTTREIPYLDMDKQGKCSSQNSVPELNEETLPMVV